jgi:hypothetical protein
VVGRLGLALGPAVAASHVEAEVKSG